MKSDLVRSRVQLDNAILEKMMTEVKETVATDVVMHKAKPNTFGALQLWAIRRNRRYFAHTRRQPKIVTGFGY